MNYKQSVSEVRFEIKYVAPASQLEDVLQWVRLNPYGFFEPYPNRQVNSLYMDTLPLAAFHENLSGVSHRKKFRFRWYGEEIDSPENGLFRYEVKDKVNRLCQKDVYSFEGVPNIPDDLSWNSFLYPFLNALSDSRLDCLGGYLNPIVLNTYKRFYFQSLRNDIRLTVDYDHTAMEQWSGICPNLKYLSDVPSPLVIEIKYPESLAFEIALLTETIPYKLSRHSKYLVNAANSLPS